MTNPRLALAVIAAAEVALLEALDAAGENKPVAALADVEFTVSGKVYTSLTFEADLELDVTRDD